MKNQDKSKLLALLR